MKFPKTVTAAQKVGRSLWDLADALAQEIPKGSPLSMFEEAAEEIVKNDGEPYAPVTLREYRDTSVAWPREARSSRVAFTAHRDLRTEPNRFEMIRDVRTQRDASALRGTPRRDDPRHKSSPEEKRQQFKELARDPDVIDDEDTVAEIARDPGVRRQVQEQTTSDAREGNARTIESDENLRGAVEEGADAAVLESLHRALTSVRRAARLSSSLETTARQREVYADLLNQLSEEIEIARFNLDVAEATSVGGGQR